MDDKKKEIMRGYQLKRDDAIYQAKLRKSKLYMTFPVLQEIEDEINKVGLSSVRKVLSKGISKEEAIRECEYEIFKLKEKREKIYIENGIPSNYIEPVFECEECEDTGFNKYGKKCVCYEQQLVESVYKLSNMSVLLKKQNFDNMNLDVYSDEIVEGKSQRDIMLGHIEISKKFIECIGNEENKSLLFYGPTGTGKTFLSSCIAKEVLDKGYTVIYSTISDLIDLAKVHTFGGVNQEINEKYESIFNCDLLIVDDLGTEIVNKHVVSEVLRLVNSRLINGKKVIISTNLNLEQIYAQYTGRVFDRLIEGYAMLKFVGPSIRKAKLD